MTLNAGVTPVTNLTTIRARRLVTVAGDAVCYVVVRESRRVGSSGTRVLRLQLVLRSAAIGMLLLLAHELFAAQKRCDVRLAVLSGPNLTNVSSLAAPSHRGSCSWAHRSCTQSVRPSLLGWHAANGWPPSWSRSSASAKRLLTRGTHDALVDHAGLRVESAQASRAQRERSCYIRSCVELFAAVS